MFLVDFSPILHSSLITPLSRSMVSYHLERFQDQFFTNPPAWFTVYTWIELLYHLPLSLWAVWGIWTDHPLVPLNLLIFSLEVAITTLTCVADISSWKTYTNGQKNDLYGLYVPYLVLACLMGVDAFFKVKKQVLQGQRKGKVA